MEKIAINIADEFGSPFGTTLNLSDLVSIIVTGAITLAGIFVLFLFIFGGYSMIAGAGQNNPQKAAQGKQAITSAVIGFVIIFVAYWIIRLIEVIIGGPMFITQPVGL